MTQMVIPTQDLSMILKKQCSRSLQAMDIQAMHLVLLSHCDHM